MPERFPSFFNKPSPLEETPVPFEATELLERLKNEDPLLNIHEAEKALAELVASGQITEITDAPDDQS